ncbi:dTDP-4-amino-4,6-dideoxygalactose transaminase [Fodinibius sp. Rm-B-1B1-1]|uniref:dTDP-4-amino-4,6-dideoxygalactose transaminase n=1 Tax=Fodinibius alkaliphilus TaxID=3140241 RepID=UPI00315B07A8
MIPFNKPYLTGKEMHYMYQAVYSGKISGNGIYTKKCQSFFEDRYDLKKALLTTSCTDALEMCALLIGIKPGDEIIVPSYTFVSTALAFVRQGAKIVFADSRGDHPGIAEECLESLITSKTKAIVPVHYAGVACDMDKIMDLADQYNLIVIEDAAQAIESTYKEKPLGSIGHLAAFSFHETKNIISGEGGLLAINDERFVGRAEIIWEKGTNRAEFFRGEVNKYEWKDTGSSFLPSDMTAAFLWAQLENIEDIQKRRRSVWLRYHKELRSWADYNNIRQPIVPFYASNNAHMYYLCFQREADRQLVIDRLKLLEIHTVSHYLSLYNSTYCKQQGYDTDQELPMSDYYSDCLLRLPLYFELEDTEQEKVIKALTAINLKKETIITDRKHQKLVAKST